MSEHERTVTVDIPPEEAFRYLSSVSNLSSFLPHVKSVTEDEDDHVFGIAEVGGRRYELSGFFRADEANRRLDWESDGTPGYRGWLQISPEGHGSRITVHLSMLSAASETPPEHAGLADQRIEQQFDGVMDVLSQRLRDARAGAPA